MVGIGAEGSFVHPEIAGKDPTILLAKALGRTALDELLYVGRVATNQPGEAGVVLPPFCDQAIKRCPLVDLSHGVQ